MWERYLVLALVSPVVFRSANTQYLAATYDPNIGKTGIFFADYSESEHGKAIAATVQEHLFPLEVFKLLQLLQQAVQKTPHLIPLKTKLSWLIRNQVPP